MQVDGIQPGADLVGNVRSSAWMRCRSPWAWARSSSFGGNGTSAARCRWLIATSSLPAGGPYLDELYPSPYFTRRPARAIMLAVRCRLVTHGLDVENVGDQMGL